MNSRIKCLCKCKQIYLRLTGMAVLASALYVFSSAAYAMAHAGCVERLINSQGTAVMPNAGLANCLLHKRASDVVCISGPQKLVITQYNGRHFKMIYYKSDKAHDREISYFKTNASWQGPRCTYGAKKCLFTMPSHAYNHFKCQ